MSKPTHRWKRKKLPPESSGSAGFYFNDFLPHFSSICSLELSLLQGISPVTTRRWSFWRAWGFAGSASIDLNFSCGCRLSCVFRVPLLELYSGLGYLSHHFLISSEEMVFPHHIDTDIIILNRVWRGLCYYIAMMPSSVLYPKASPFGGGFIYFFNISLEAHFSVLGHNFWEHLEFFLSFCLCLLCTLHGPSWLCCCGSRLWPCWWFDTSSDVTCRLLWMFGGGFWLSQGIRFKSFSVPRTTLRLRAHWCWSSHPTH